MSSSHRTGGDSTRYERVNEIECIVRENDDIVEYIPYKGVFMTFGLIVAAAGEIPEELKNELKRKHSNAVTFSFPSMGVKFGKTDEGEMFEYFEALYEWYDRSMHESRYEKNELHQVAQQASNVDHLMEVICKSMAIMSKQWSDAMHVYHEKFNALSSLIIDHGLDSTPQEEFLSLLGGARTSPPVHQFLVNSLGEAGLKRVAKAISGAGKELQTIVLDHLQKLKSKLRGLSKWRARFSRIGLEEGLIDNATEKAGMVLVQIERFIRILSSVVRQFSNFFNWLLKCVKVLMSKPGDQLLPCSSELVILFLKFLYDQDPVGALLQDTQLDHNIEVDSETKQRVTELAYCGGFSDSEYLKRTLAKEFQLMESCFKEALGMPLATVSRRILCKDMLPLFPLSSLLNFKSSSFPVSVSYYQEASHRTTHQRLTDYTSFVVPDETFCIGVVRGLIHDADNLKRGHNSLEVALLRIPDGYCCADLSLYKEEQIVLLLNDVSMGSESSGNACMMMVQTADLAFVSISRSSVLSSWNLHELQDNITCLHLENEKVREIPHSVLAPLAVSEALLVFLVLESVHWCIF